MFTGLIQAVGRVVGSKSVPAGRRLDIDPQRWSHRPAAGESIAVSGCCLTHIPATEPQNPDTPAHLHFDVVPQTLDATTLGSLRPGDPVNLEHAVTPHTLLGGHIVQGHIDALGEVRTVTDEAGDRRVRIAASADALDCIVERGSVAVDGVSLTVARTGAGWFEIALIPTTLDLTTLGSLRPGDRVNLETDYLAKTVVHWLRRQRAADLAGVD